MPRAVALVVMIPFMFLGGCVAPFYTPVTDQRTVAQAYTPLYCRGGNCVLKWRRALDFVSEHSGYRFQCITEDSAETYGPSKGSNAIATIIRKEALGNDKYQIVIDIYCGANLDDIVSCSGKNRLLKYEAAFKQAVIGSATSKTIPRVSAPMPVDHEPELDWLRMDQGPKITVTNIGPATSAFPLAAIMPATTASL